MEKCSVTTFDKYIYDLNRYINTSLDLGHNTAQLLIEIAPRTKLSAMQWWLFYLEFDKQNAFVRYLDIQHSNKELNKKIIITTVSKTEALYQIGIILTRFCRVDFKMFENICLSCL